MRTTPHRLLLVLLALLLPGLAGAQGLGDVAARERQKREAAGSRPKARVLSNDDLRKGSEKSAADSAAAAGGSAASQAPATSNQPRNENELGHDQPDAEAEDPRQAALAQAQAAVESARSEVVAAEERVKELGDKLNPMSPSFIYGANQTGDAVGEEMRTREALTQAQAQLAQARDALVKANQEHERVSRGLPAGSTDDR
jgi:hypothetical protein